MNIGIVTTWFERGAAYVSRAYMELLQSEGHNVYIYARGGEVFAKEDTNWNQPNVTWGERYRSTKISTKDFYKWIEKNNIEAILFNEQQNFEIVAKVKKDYSNIKICAYIDYYTERTLHWYNMYDFVICNTFRHIQAMDKHPQSYYLKWGTDTDIFSPREIQNSCVTFFHSVGMSHRKGTDILINAFIEGKLYKNSKLIIHTQIPIQKVSKYEKEQLEEYNIQIIEKTVKAPGLYHLGDVYVYPTRLEGLGLTIYEALACGLPVITTDYPPMNEPIDESVGKLVKVERNFCREDGYYWPLAACDMYDLIHKMEFYINNPSQMNIEKANARRKAEMEYNFKERAKELSDIFNMAIVRTIDMNLYDDIIAYYKNVPKRLVMKLMEENTFLNKIKVIMSSK